MRLSKKVREELKHKYGGHCAYCGEVLGDKWHADHIEPVIRKCKAVRIPGTRMYKLVSTDEMHQPQKDHLNNMNPSCVACNLYKGACSLEGFRKMIMDGFRGSIDRTMSLRAAVRYGIITITPLAECDVVFWFEKFEADKEEAANAC